MKDKDIENWLIQTYKWGEQKTLRMIFEEQGLMNILRDFSNFKDHLKEVKP